MKSIYNPNWFNVKRGLFYKNGVNLTFAVAIKHMIVFHENSEQGQHIPLLIIIAVINYYRSIIGLDSTCSFIKKTRE